MGYIFMALFSVACGFKKKKKKKKLYLWMRMRVSYIITALQVLSYQFIHNDVHALAGVFEVDSWMIGTKRKRKRII